jgi:hypothetical protein
MIRMIESDTVAENGVMDIERWNRETQARITRLEARVTALTALLECPCSEDDFAWYTITLEQTQARIASLQTLFDHPPRPPERTAAFLRGELEAWQDTLNWALEQLEEALTPEAMTYVLESRDEARAQLSSLTAELEALEAG